MDLDTRDPRNAQRKRSPRQAIEHTIRELSGPDIHLQERISPYITTPWWQGPKQYLEQTSEDARDVHLEQLSDHTAIHIYTDGSGIGGHLGAAAVCTTTQEERRAYMGTEQISTVYAAELQGILMALEIAQNDKQQGYTRSKACIFTATRQPSDHPPSLKADREPIYLKPSPEE
jgi:hypothetical protein